MTKHIRLDDDPTQVELSYPKGRKVQKIVINLEEEFLVKPETLQRQLCETVSRWGHWAAVVVALYDRVQELKRIKEEVYAVTSIDIRNGWNVEEWGKRTEGAIADRVKSSKEYMEACSMLAEASSSLAISTTIRDGYEKQKEVLNTLSANMRSTGEMGVAGPGVVQTPPRPGEDKGYLRMIPRERAKTLGENFGEEESDEAVEESTKKVSRARKGSGGRKPRTKIRRAPVTSRTKGDS